MAERRGKQTAPPATHRARVVASLNRYLLRRGLPRFQMTVIVVGTGLAGFGVSALLLRLGVTSMPWRYTIATLAGYVVFLLLVRVWAEYQRRRLDVVEDLVDVGLDFVPDLPAVPSGPGPWVGGEGRFGGGGAGRSWTEGSHAVDLHDAPATPDVVPASEAAGSWFDVDLDDAWVLVVPALLLAGGVALVVYAVAAAPVLLAEVLLDVVLVSGLYRRLRTIEPQSWLTTAVRRTWVPVVVVTLVLALAGYVVQAAVPTADSMGDLFR